MSKNNQLARIICLLNEQGYEINDREIDETNAFEAVELVLAQLEDSHTALDAAAEDGKSKEAVIIPALNRKPGNGKPVPSVLPEIQSPGGTAMVNKKIFLVDVAPFAHRTPDVLVGEFVYEHELVEETEDNYITVGMFSSQDIVRYPRELYTAFYTREEAFIHLDRIAVDMLDELEEQTQNLHQFINAIDDEFRKGSA